MIKLPYPVIADWMVKPMDGLTKHVRNDSPSPNPFVPVILMTGQASAPALQRGPA